MFLFVKKEQNKSRLNFCDSELHAAHEPYIVTIISLLCVYFYCF